MMDDIYRCAPYKMFLAKSDRDIFGYSISSNEWDKVVKLLDEDVDQEVFTFVHPKKSNIVYERNYVLCPVSGNTKITLGRLRDTSDYTYIRIVTTSHKYKEPYIVFEDYYPTFPNPEILVEIVTRSFNKALEKYGLEVILKPWESDGPIFWALDSDMSHSVELKKHPEAAHKCIGFQKALEYVSIVKENKISEKKKRGRKDDRSYRDCITVKDKDAVLKIAHEYSDGITKACVVMIVQKAMIDAGVLKRPSHHAFVEEFGSGKGRSATAYSELNNPDNHQYDADPLYLKLLDIFTKIKNEQK